MSYAPTSEALAGRERIAANLRRLRKARGLTQERLAHDAGLARTFVVRVEAGQHSLMLDRVFDLAHALQVDVAELVRPL
jgi:transcriptional regulator with XRE-family HTH domain